MKILVLMAFFGLTFSPFSYSSDVLIIGDSLSVGLSSDEKDGTRSGLGRELGKLLEKKGHNVSVEASCGSSPMSYISKYKSYSTPCGYYQKFSGEQKMDRPSSPTPKLKDIVGSTKAPDLMVIQQGTNLYWAIQQGSIKYIEDKVVELLKEYEELSKMKTPKSRCLWVGPPAILRINNKMVTNEQTDLMVNAIQSGIKKSGIHCEYFDSRTKTKVEGLSRDGTHYRTGQIDEWIDHSYKLASDILDTPNFNAQNIDCNSGKMNPVLNEEFLRNLKEIKIK